MSNWLFDPAQEAGFMMRRTQKQMQKDPKVAVSQKNLAVNHMLERIRRSWVAKFTGSSKMMELWAYVEKYHDLVIHRAMRDAESYLSLASGKHAAEICKSVKETDAYAKEAKRMRPITVGNHTYLVDSNWSEVFVPLSEPAYINEWLDSWVDQQSFRDAVAVNDDDDIADELEDADSTQFTNLDVGDVLHALIMSSEVHLPCDVTNASESWLFAMEADVESVMATTKTISEKLGTMDQAVVQVVQKSQYTADDVRTCQNAVQTVQDLIDEVKKLYSMGDKLANFGRAATNTVVHGAQTALVVGGTVGGAKLGRWAGERGIAAGFCGLIAGAIAAAQISKLKITNHGPGNNKHDSAQTYLGIVRKDLSELSSSELRKFLNCLMNDLHGLEKDYLRVATYIDECVTKNGGNPMDDATESFQFVFD